MSNEILLFLTAISVIFILMIVLLTVLMKMRSDLPKNRRKSVDFSNGADPVSGRIDGGANSSRFGFNDDRGTVVVNINIKDRNTVQVRLRSRSDGSVYTIAVRDSVVLGRLAGPYGSQQYCVSDLPTVSKSHCIITENGGQLYIKDNNSTNHTFLNDRYISGYSQLKNGDIIRLGNDAEFTVEIV